jgi:hypothetical protein
VNPFSQTSAAAVLVLLAAVGWAPTSHAQDCFAQPFGAISSPYGEPRGSSFHRGADYVSRARQPAVPAVGDGIVVSVGRAYTSAATNCLGNMVEVRHSNGIFSTYSHLSAIGVSQGQAVTRGQSIGNMGNTGSCSFGEHLHLVMSTRQNGAWGTWGDGTVDPHSYINARLTCNRPPVGFLDGATCDGIRGWASDPDVPTQSISVHVYLGGPTAAPGVSSIALRADQHRADLCSTVGCTKGFSMKVPPSFFDGRPRQVFAYGIDSAGGANPQLQSSGRTLTCSPDLLVRPSGVVRRKLPTTAAFTAWKFDPSDLAPIGDNAIDGYEDGPALPLVPTLVKEQGQSEVSVLEYGARRKLSSASATAFKFPAASIAVATPGSMDDLLVGADWPATPFLVRHSNGDVYLLDAPPPLWAEVVSTAWPQTLVVGEVAEASVRLRNRGSLTWTSAVQLTSPKGAPSVLCDPSWATCEWPTSVEGEVKTLEETTLRFMVLAPLTPGPVTSCFSLRTGTHSFSDVGQNGPADDLLCWTVQVEKPLDAQGRPTTPVKDQAAPVVLEGSTMSSSGCNSSGAMGPGLVALLRFCARRRVRGASSRR